MSSIICLWRWYIWLKIHSMIHWRQPRSGAFHFSSCWGKCPACCGRATWKQTWLSSRSPHRMKTTRQLSGISGQHGLRAAHADPLRGHGVRYRTAVRPFGPGTRRSHGEYRAPGLPGGSAPLCRGEVPVKTDFQLIQLTQLWRITGKKLKVICVFFKKVLDKSIN